MKLTTLYESLKATLLLTDKIVTCLVFRYNFNRENHS